MTTVVRTRFSDHHPDTHNMSPIKGGKEWWVPVALTIVALTYMTYGTLAIFGCTECHWLMFVIATAYALMAHVEARRLVHEGKP